MDTSKETSRKQNPVEFGDGLFTLNTKHSQYQLFVDAYGILNHAWYGAKTDQDMRVLYDYHDTGFSPTPGKTAGHRAYSLDTRLQEYPSAGMGDYRIQALQIRQANGLVKADLRYVGCVIQENVPAPAGMPHARPDQDAVTLRLELADPHLGLHVFLYYCIYFEEDCIVRYARLENRSDQPMEIEGAASLSLDLPAQDLELIHFEGRHMHERAMERIPLPHGITEISSGRGTSSHQHNPAVILAEPATTETQGSCWGMAMIYSGSFAIQAEVDQMDQTRIVMGLNPRQFSWKLEPEAAFETPQAILSYSARGLEQLSKNYHTMARNHIIHPDFACTARPVLINNWEATYFDFDGEKILDIAKSASDLGIDMLVLDDGWFGKRDNDLSGLGDWKVNEEKLGMPLACLIDKVHEQGLKFGIWIEPEMVSQDSDLYRAHPDWALQGPGYDPILSRDQLVLDFSRPEVVDAVYAQIHDLLEKHEIDYIKWDMNRSLGDWYSPSLPAERQKELGHRYMLGVYDLHERLRRDFPTVLLEGCSGGGGRFDFGLLYYAPQIWTSDDTDARERGVIQHGTSFFYPLSSMGSHVSAIPNHQCGRKPSLAARAVMAMHGSFGYELDLSLASEEDKTQMRQWTQIYHELQPLLYNGEFFRLWDPGKNNGYLYEVACPDKKQAIVAGLIYAASPNTLRHRLKLRNLDPNARYAIRDRIDPETGYAPQTGASLMEAGLLLPRNWGDDFPVLLELTRL